MKTIKKVLSLFMLWIFWITNLYCNISFAQSKLQSPYDDVLGTTTDDISVNSAINGGDVLMQSSKGKYGADLFNEQIIKIISYVIDIFIVVWIAVAFFGGYKIMTSDKEESLKEWIRLVIFWIIWIIIMVSARFIANTLVWTNGIIVQEFGNVSAGPNWVRFADNLYQNIMYPFIKMVLYFVLWALFLMMAGKVISFATSTDDSIKKKTAWIIIRCIVGILIVMWSKQIVEAVMWKQTDVLNRNAQRISWWDDGLWEEILEFNSIPLIAQIINRVMWLTMLIILVLIIIQWYKVFTKPDDPKTREGMKKAILYILIWVLVIWASYIISNVLVLNNIPIETATEGW